MKISTWLGNGVNVVNQCHLFGHVCLTNDVGLLDFVWDRQIVDDLCDVERKEAEKQEEEEVTEVSQVDGETHSFKVVPVNVRWINGLSDQR